MKVTRKLQIDKERDEVFSEKLGEKFSKFNDLKTLLEDCNLISDPILEEAREFDLKTNKYFVPVENLDYS